MTRKPQAGAYGKIRLLHPGLVNAIRAVAETEPGAWVMVPNDRPIVGIESTTYHARNRTAFPAACRSCGGALNTGDPVVEFTAMDRVCWVHAKDSACGAAEATRG